MQARFSSAFHQLPASLQQALSPFLHDDHFPGMLQAADLTRISAECHLEIQELLFALLPLAACYAVTPISHFNVGAIALGVSGNAYFGANMEFPGRALQQTVHAEQCAITHSWLRGERALRSITINYTPCGHCRQFMNELNCSNDLVIQVKNQSAAPLHYYLPHAFGPRDLAITELLMDDVNHGYHLTHHDLLTSHALQAANRSHAPYSQAHSGVALQMNDGTVYAGRYAENAAFNPSLPPLQAALILMNLSGGHSANIQQAVLVERHNAQISQWNDTQATLHALGCTSINCHHY